MFARHAINRDTMAPSTADLQVQLQTSVQLEVPRSSLRDQWNNKFTGEGQATKTRKKQNAPGLDRRQRGSIKRPAQRTTVEGQHKCLSQLCTRNRNHKVSKDTMCKRKSQRWDHWEIKLWKTTLHTEAKVGLRFLTLATDLVIPAQW